jgi:hypothetical protein
MTREPNRRSMLRRVFAAALTSGVAAAIAPVSVMVAAAAPDPVFALLEAHKQAWARLLALDDDIDLATEDEAGRAADVALGELTTTPPTTRAGMRAVMEYFVELGGHDDCLPTLLKSSILRSPLFAQA